MASTQPNQTPRNVLSGLFGPKFLDDPDALSGVASSLGMDSGATPGNPAASAPPTSPDASGAASPANSAPVQGVVPKSFNEWAQDPVNLAKIPQQVNNSPLPGANPSIPPLIARPQSDSASVTDPTAPQGQDVAARGITSGATAAPAMPSSIPGDPIQPPTPSVFPNRADWLAANPNAAAIPLPPHKYGTRGSIAMALATIGDTMGAALTGGRPVVGPNWLEQVQAGREYERNLPVLTQQAQTAAYEKAQEEAGKGASIAGTQANTAHVVAETNALLGGGPFYEQAGKARQEIEKLHADGSLAPADFVKQAQMKLQSLAPNVRRLIPDDYIQQVMALPRQQPGKVMLNDDLPTGVGLYGKTIPIASDKSGKPAGFIVDGKPIAFGDPSLPQELQSKVPEIQAQYGTHVTKRGEKLADESAVAGFAADRQGRQIAASETRQAAQFTQQQKMENYKKAEPRYETALDADQRLGRMETALPKAEAGDQQAMLSLLTDHIGMTLGMQKGARITKDILNEAQQSQPWLSKISAKFDDRGYLSGVTLGKEQMHQMVDLGYEARDRSWQGAFDASKLHGADMPPGAMDVYNKRVPGAKPALGGQIIVTAPDGSKHPFDNQAQADAFKKLAHIQ